MAQLVISHPDGRRYEVSDKAFADLYEPFGFTSEGISHMGTMLPDNDENRQTADAAYGVNPNETDLTRENAQRVVILSDLEAEARQKMAAEQPVSPTATVPTQAMIDPNAPKVDALAENVTSVDVSKAPTSATPKAAKVVSSKPQRGA